MFETNFFGVIRVTTAFVSLLRKSSNPVILNISSGLGSMTRQAGAMKDKPAGVQLPGTVLFLLLPSMLNEPNSTFSLSGSLSFLLIFSLLGYNSSKSALNAYTIALGASFPEVFILAHCLLYIFLLSLLCLFLFPPLMFIYLLQARVNVISPGYVATRMNKYKGQLSPEESAAGVIRFGILLDQSGPTTSFLDHSGSVWPW